MKRTRGLSRPATTTVIAGLLTGLTAALLLSPNLASAQVVNPSAEVANQSGDGPTAWTAQSWGDVQAALSWGNIGADGARCLQVDVTTTGAQGDARWLSDAVAVLGGETYTLSVQYRATTDARLAAQAIGAGGETQWIHVADTGPASDWREAQGNLKLPPWAVQVRVAHLLAKVGSLWTDNVALTKLPPPPKPKDGSSNVVPNPSMEATAAPGKDGTTAPDSVAGWGFVTWGEAKGSGAVITGDAATGSRFLRATLTTAATDSDVKWWTVPIAVSTGSDGAGPGDAGQGDWLLSVRSRGTTRMLLGLHLTFTDGTTGWQLLKWTQASDTWTRTTMATVLPNNVATVRVAAIINAVGVAEIDDVSLMRAAAGGDPKGPLLVSIAVDAADAIITPAVDALAKRGVAASFYVPTAALGDAADKALSGPAKAVVSRLRQAQDTGHEIGAFGEDPKTWANLTPAQHRAAIIRAFTRFKALNLKLVGLATPGNAWDDGVVEAVDSAGGYLRTLEAGTNYPPFAYLKVLVRNVTATTAAATVQRWANEARRHGAWLVLRYAGVGPSGAVDAARLGADLDMVLGMGAKVVPVGAALDRWQKPAPGEELTPPPRGGRDFFSCSASPASRHAGDRGLGWLLLLAGAWLTLRAKRKFAA